MNSILIVACVAITAVALLRERRVWRATKSLLRRAVARLLVALEDAPGSNQHRQ